MLPLFIKEDIMNRIIKQLLLLIILAIPFSVKSNDTIYYSNQKNLNIVNHTALYIDSSNKETINTILSQHKNVFKKCGFEEIHIPFNAPNLWFKCIIKNQTKQQQFLNIDVENATIYNLQFYDVRKGIISPSKEMGIKYPFDYRPIHNITFIHRLTLDSGSIVECYIKIQTNGDALNIPIKLYSNTYFIKKSVNQSTMLGIIIGFIFALILIAFYSLYISDKEFTYLYFALYSIFGGLWILNNDGFTYQDILSKWPFMYDLAIKMVPLTAIYLFSQFGIRYLNLKKASHFFYNFIYWYNWILLATICVMPFRLLPQSIIVQIETFEIVTVTSLNLIAALFTIKLNRTDTYYYLTANLILIIGILIVSFNIVFGYSSVEMRSSLLKFGLLFQMTVLLFALTTKIRKIQKSAELQLQDSKQKYFDILENAIEAIFIIQNQRIKFSNTQLSILTKYQVNELLNFELTKIVQTEDKDRIENLLLQQSKGHSSGKKAVFRAVDKEGYEIWMEMISVPIIWEHKPATLNFMNDISQRVMSEREKETLEKQLLHAQKMETIGTLAGGIAHDFNNILTPIIGYSEILLATATDEEQKEDLTNIKTSAHRAKELVSQILRFSHQIDTSKEIVDVNKIIIEVTKLLDAVIPSSITLKAVPNAESVFVYINPTQLHQVIMNICTNAYQSISKNKGNITVSVSVLNEDSEQLKTNNLPEIPFIRISIEDNGSGIDESIKARIFDPFFTTKKVGEGTGLGLSVVYGIIKNIGGIITCDSTIGVGTRFDILIPACLDTNIAETNTIQLEKGNHENILIVDDEEKIAKMLKKLIDAEGFSASVEFNSSKALELIKNNPLKFRILVSDLTMPNITGVELAKLALEYNKDLKFIFVTGHITQSYSDTIKEIPNAALIRKPIDFSKLHQAINEQLKINNV